MDTLQVLQNTSDNNFMYPIISWITNIGGFASILGFLFSLYVAKNVYNVKRYIFIMKRLPQYLKSFEVHGSIINELSGNFEKNKEEIIDEITKCHSDTKNLKKKIPRDLRAEINKMNIEIKKVLLKKDTIALDDSRKVYRHILSVTQSIQNFQKDYKTKR